jgi:hypothetical protein
LLFAVAANEEWIFHFYLFVSGPEAGDINVHVTGPSGSTVRYAVTSPGSAVTTGLTSQSWTKLAHPNATAASTSGIDNTASIIEVWGIVRNGATADNCTLQWAQAVATGSDTTVYADSWLLAVKEGLTPAGSSGGGGGVTDHGALTGLTGDDHTQYLLAAGTRALTADWDAGSFEIRAQTFESDVATGTAPLVIASTTKVTNLNADLLDDQSGAHYLDSANFTGTDWTDLTDAGETALHSHAGGSGDVATDAIWDADGDLARGSGADTAARLATGVAGTVLIGGTSWSASPVIGTALILGSADTSGVRFDIESGAFAVREGDDSAYAPVAALTYNTGAGPVTNPLVKFIANATETIAANIAGYEFSPTLTTSGNSRAVYGVYAAPVINVANASSGHEIFGLRFTPTISGAGASASLVRIGAIDANASLASVNASCDISATEIYGLKMGSLGELGLGNFDAAGAIALSSTAALADVTVTTAYGIFNNGITLQALNSGLITVTTAYGDFNGGFWMEVLGTGNVLVTTGYASFIRAPQMSAAVSTGNTTITTYEALHIGGGAYADADFTIGASTQLRIEDMTGARITGNNRLLEIGTSTPTTTSGLFRMVGNFTAAANQTPLYVSEGATPTVRQFRTKDGAAITGGDLVVVLV